MEIFKEFTFDSAHFLPNVAEGHKCRNIHGHTYRVRLYIAGKPDSHSGMIQDFADIKSAFKPVEKLLDHQLLNEVDGLENPTTENFIVWLWRKLKPELPGMSKIEVYETPTCGVVYKGEWEN
ncbi:MAG: 6-carboxytetrahydropterin synthase QueD [Bacteroidota bacterium]